MTKLKVLDLFSGIGGFSLGLERTGGFETVAFCEIEKFPRKVLAKNWPKVPCYHDIRELTAAKLAADGIAVDAICGGFPCQDISTAGKGAGIAGERSGLWKEYARLIGELRPQFAIMENVSALLGRGLDVVLGDLAQIGYDAEWHCIPASAIGAPHRRDRIWIIAHPSENGNSKQSFTYEGKDSMAQKGAGVFNELCSMGIGRKTEMANSNKTQCKGNGSAVRILKKYTITSSTSWWTSEPDVGRVANGVPDRAHRLAALGNAIVPQIATLIGEAILASHN